MTPNTLTHGLVSRASFSAITYERRRRDLDRLSGAIRRMR